MITEKENEVSNIITIDGLQFNLNFATIINSSPIPKSDISLQPVANIYKKKPSTKPRPKYTVNVFAYIPIQLNPLNQVDKSFTLINNQVYFQYENVKEVETEIQTKNNNLASCRNFKVVYDGPEKQQEFNLIHIQFKYQVSDNTQTAEAIYVRDENLDPAIDRGTVTTPIHP